MYLVLLAGNSTATKIWSDHSSIELLFLKVILVIPKVISQTK